MSDLLRRIRRLEEALGPKDDHKNHVLFLSPDGVFQAPDGTLGVRNPLRQDADWIPDCPKCQEALRKEWLRQEQERRLDEPLRPRAA
jgi:hypothetical protein